MAIRSKRDLEIVLSKLKVYEKRFFPAGTISHSQQYSGRMGLEYSYERRSCRQNYR